MRDAPVFLLVSERSGSNLLRTLLAQHSTLAGPVSPHLFFHFDATVDLYGDLRLESNARRLFEDMLGLVNLELYSWNLDICFEDAYAAYQPRSFIDFVDFFYLEKARQDGKPNYVCKELNLFDYVPLFGQRLPNARWIYLYRDPRDTAASVIKRPQFRLTAMGASRKWNHEQMVCLKLRDAYGFDLTSVSYESLVSDTPGTMTGILEALGLPVEEACFSTEKKKAEELAWNPVWENLAKPIMSDNFNKFESEFDRKTIEMIETICAPAMKRLGYPFTTDARWKKTPLVKFMHRFEKQRLNKVGNAARMEPHRRKDAYVSSVRKRVAQTQPQK